MSALSASRLYPADLFRPLWRWGRLSIALLVVVLMHASAVLWLARQQQSIALPPRPAVLEARLLATQPITLVVAQPALAPAPQPTHPPHPPRRAASPLQHPPTRVEALHALAPLTPTQPATVPLTDETSPRQDTRSATPTPTPTGNDEAAAPAADEVAAPAAETTPFDLPPSQVVRYDSFVNGMQNPPAVVTWQNNERRYTLEVAVPVPFVGPYIYHSSGGLDTWGLAPDRYVETRGKRPPVATYFNRDARQTISFPRPPATLPLPAGAQDRFSMLYQLASLVRGQPAQYDAGATREFFVANTRNGENWRIQSVGNDVLQTEDDFIVARHFVRLPRSEKDTRRLEVWLAESLGWIPVKLQQTEPDGMVLELVYHSRKLD